MKPTALSSPSRHHKLLTVSAKHRATSSKKGLLRSTLAFLLGLIGHTSIAADVDWDGGASDSLWSSAINWSPDGLPANGDTLQFINPAAGFIYLDGNRLGAYSGLNFSGGGLIQFGAAGSSSALSLSVTTPNISIASGTTVNLNTGITGPLNFNGGGTVIMDNYFTPNGNITVDGPGTTLRVVSHSALPYAVGSVTIPRGDTPTLGPIAGTAETITLTNGGTLQYAGYGLNPDAATKNIVLGTGGGVLDISNGMYLNDDASQISGSGSLTKTGLGRYVLRSQAYGLSGGIIVQQGVIEMTQSSVVTTTSNHVVNGGIFALGYDQTTAFNLDVASITLNNTGALGVSGTDHRFGNAAGTSILTLNGGNLLGADYQDGRTSRNLRINGQLQGSGTVQIIGGAGSGTGTPTLGNHRIVLQRAGAQTNFNGRFVLNDSTGIENNPGNDSGTGTGVTGNALGNATIEFKGTNTALDLRDNGTGNNQTIGGYTGVNLELTSTRKGGTTSLAVTRSTANTGNTIELGSLTMGSQYFDINAQNSYRAAFTGTVLIQGNATIATRANGGTNGSIQFNTAINEEIAGRSLSKVGPIGTQMNALSSINVTTVNLVQGNLNLQGANGSIGLGKGGSATLNTSINGNLVLDDTQGVAAGQRLNSGLNVNMRGGTITLLSGVGGSNQTIENLNVAIGYNTFTATANSSASVMRLGNATTWSRGNNAVVNFTGTNLGTAGNNGRILIGGQADSSFLGGWALVTSGSNLEYAKYDATGGLGVSAFTAYTTGASAGNYVSGNHIKKTDNATTTTGATSIGSLNLQVAPAMAASTDTLKVGGAANLLRIESGGIVASGANATFIDHNTAATDKGQITAGLVTDTDATLYITNNSALSIGSRLVNNGTGAVTVVKSGTGTLFLTNTNATATNNSFTGGLIINSGTVRFYGASGSGTSTDALSSDVTLAGGSLVYNSNSTTAGGHTSTRTITVAASGSTLLGDNNIASTDANGSTNNKNITFAGLNFTAPASGEGAPTLNFGGFDSTDMIFQTVNISNTPTLNMLTNDSNSYAQFNRLSGTGDLILTQTSTSYNSSTSEILILGSGSGDSTANNYTGDIILRGGRLLLNKANNTNTITGDLYINGGTVSWGGTGRANQMAATSKVYLMAGTLGQGDESTSNGMTNDYDALVHELIMTGGQLNSGRNNFTISKATISGGNINVQGVSNLGATMTLNNTELLHGAPNINVQGDAPTDLTVLVLGGDYFRTSGQNISLMSAPSVISAGAEIRLLTDVTVNLDPHMANSLTSGITIGAGRELGLTARLDLGGGNRTFNIAEGAFYTIQPNIINGGLIKSGDGTMVLSSFLNQSTYDGNVQVNAGTLVIRNNSSLGSTVGSTTIASGATLEVESSVTSGENITLSGYGAQDKNAALLSYRGDNTFTGNVAIAGNTAVSTYASNIAFDSSARPATLASFYSRSTLRFTNAVSGTGNLALRGDGNLYLDGGLTHNGGVIKDGHGYAFLSGAGTYTGFTDVIGGVLHTSTTLGTASQGTRVLGGASLLVSGNVNLGAENIEIHGTGHASQRGALVNHSGSNSVSGPVRLVTDAQNPTTAIHSTEGLISLAGGLISSTNANVVLSGSGDGSISGGVATGSGTLTKRGSGKWTLTGSTASTLTGATTIEGGTLEVNTASNQLADGAALNMNGGNLTLLGSGTEAVNGLNLNAGGAEVNLGSATLAVGSINRSAGATVNFAANGNLTTTATNSNGILGAYATIGGRNWATVNGSTVSALTAYTTLFEDTGLATGTPSGTPALAVGNNLLVNRTQQNVSTTAITANSLKITTGLGLAQKNLAMTLGSGGVLYDGTAGSNFGMAGTGSLTAGGGELVFHVHEGTLDVNMIIAGTNGITKDGSGTLFLNSGNTFTGDININGGTLAIAGATSVTTTLPAVIEPTSLGATGARTINLNGGTFSLIAGNYIPSAGTKSFVIGTGGGTIHVGGGDSVYSSTIISRLLLSQPGQLSGTGTLIKTGDGRLELATAYDFTGDIIVRDGILIATNTAIGGRLPNQTVTVERGGTFALGIASSQGFTQFDGQLVLKDGSRFMTSGDNATTALDGFVTIEGNVETYLQNIGNLGQNGTIAFNNRVTLGTGSTWNIYGRDGGTTGNTGGGQLLLNSVNDISGTVRLNANALMVATHAGALGNATNRATVELAGPNARLMLRENSTADFNFNLNVHANSVLELRNAGANSGHYFSINNLNIADNIIFTVTGGNNEQVHVAGTTNFAGTSILNFNASNVNAVFREVTGGNNISKLGAGNLFLTGNTAWQGTYTQYLGTTHLSQAGALANISSIVLKGGRLTIDNSQGSFNLNRIADTASIIMYGGEIFSSGVETVGSFTARGSVDIRQIYASTTLGTNSASVLTFTGAINREKGGTIDFRAESGGTLGNTGVNPRIVFTTQATSGFLGGGIVNGNDWAQYITTVDSGHQRGVFVMNSYLTNAAENTWTAATHLNTDSAYTLTASRSLNSLRFNTSTARTITLGAHNLNIVSGGILVTTTGGTHSIGASISDTGKLTAGTADGTADELFIHLVNGAGALVINAIIADNGTDPLSVVKASGGNLTLANPDNSFTGGLYLNEGTITHTNLTKGLGADNGDIIMQGGTLALRHDNGNANNGTLTYLYNINARANSTLSIDRLTNTTGTTINGSNMVFRKLTIDDATLNIRNNINTTTQASNYNIAFNNGAEFKGLAVLDIARNGSTGNQAVATISGVVSGDGDLYKNNAGRVEFGTADLLDNSVNTWTGNLIVNAGEVYLQKTAGTQAIGGNIIMNGGTMTLFSSDQIADTSDIIMNFGTINFRANAETIRSLTVNGGMFRTNTGGGATAASIVTVKENVTVNGVSQVDSIRVDAGTTLDIQGTLYLNGPMARIEVVESGTIRTNNIEMTGSTFRVGSGNGVSNLILNGNVTTFASEQSAIINGDNDSDSFLNLGSSNTIFNVADGAATDDLIVTPRIRNATGVTTGGFTKTGAGTMVIAGTNGTIASSANTFNGVVNVNEGRLDLRKDSTTSGTAGTAISGTALNIASGASVRQLFSHQITDTTSITVDGTYDLDYGNASETVGAVSGSNANAQILLGPGSALTTSFTTASGIVTYAGRILGTGASNNTTATGGVIKTGNGTWRLTGNSEFAGNTIINAGELALIGMMKGNTTYVKTGATLSGTGSVANVVLEAGSFLKPGNAADTTNTSIASLTIAGDFSTIANSTVLMQLQSATTNSTFGGFAVGSTNYINFITNEANTNAAWRSTTNGSMDRILIVGTEGNNGDITLAAGTQFTFNALGYTGVAGDVFKLIDWTGIASNNAWATANSTYVRGSGDIADLDLPTLTAGLLWDTRLFSSHGTLLVVGSIVPEPSRALLLMVAFTSMILFRRRR